jgi:hypothetical protein
VATPLRPRETWLLGTVLVVLVAGLLSVQPVRNHRNAPAARPAPVPTTTPTPVLVLKGWRITGYAAGSGQVVLTVTVASPPGVQTATVRSGGSSQRLRIGTGQQLSGLVRLDCAAVRAGRLPSLVLAVGDTRLSSAPPADLVRTAAGTACVARALPGVTPPPARRS